VHIHIDKQYRSVRLVAEALMQVASAGALRSGRDGSDQVLYGLPQLGSDVPYSFPPALLWRRTRRNARVLPLDIPYTTLLCNPNVHVSTAWAYGQIRPEYLEAGKPQACSRVGMKTPSSLPPSATI